MKRTPTPPQADTSAQTPDYSGTYYIASRGYDGNPENTDNYYLCPTKGWISYKADDAWEEGDSNPFLTTYKCKSNAYQPGSSNAVWIIEKHPTENYYYIKHKSDGKYLVSNGKISGTSNANRMRVHIETVAQDDLDDKALFAINPYSQTLDNVVCSYLVISPKSEDGWNKGQTIDNRLQDLKWYTVNGGNQPYLYGKTKDGGPSGHKETGGVLGLYTEYDANAQFYFEDVITRPTITCNTSNQITITAAQTGDVTIKYTTDGSTPSSTNGETYSAPFSLAEGVTTIKAITIGTDWVSNVATFTNHKRLIQSQNNAWNTTDFHFYMTPGDEVSGITKVNTTSLFRSSMEWTFRSASVEKGIQYYYIINNANNKYLCYDATNAVYMDEFGSGDNKFKFFIKESSRYSGTFHIIPYGNNILISKNNGNTSADAINTVGNNTNSNAISENAHWKFILPTDLDTDPPFTVTDASAHITKYYQIASVGSSGYYIVPPTGNNTNATTSNSADAAVVKSGTWYFEVAPAATASDWCTYYYIRNAETGKFLYFTKDANDAGACLEMKDAIESGNEERYKFTWARTATENTYYIIPKFVKDASQNQFSTLRRDGGTLKSNLNRGAGNYAWTFVEAALFCSDPIFEEEEGVIKIKCNTNASQIYINTESNADPDANSTLYAPTATTQNWTTTEKVRIKAIAVVSDGVNSASSTNVVTLLNKPDITLEAGPYIYKGAAWEPAVTKVSIGESGSETEAGIDPTTYTVNYSSDHMNVGTVTVTLENKEEGNWYVWNASTTFTINPKAVTVTAGNQTKSYGDADPELTATIDGLVTGESEELIVYTISREEGNAVGSSYAITPSGEVAQGNYTVTYVPGTLTVTPKAVTVTADNKTKTYGDADPPLTVTIDGLVTGESESLISYTISRATGETVGSYTITATGETAQGNYTVTYPTGTLTISKRPVRIISGITAENRTYDGTTNATLVMTGATFGEGDVLTGDDLTIDSATGTFDTKDVGNGKTVTISGLNLVGTDAGNYELASSGNQTTIKANITPASLSVTANNKTIGYGDAPDNDGVDYEGFVNNEDYKVLGGTLEYSYNSAVDGSGTAYTNTSPAHTYYIIPSGLTSGNYTITFVPGTLTVEAKIIGDGTTPAEGFSISVGIGSENSFVVKNGETTLHPVDDYTVNTVSTSGKYSTLEIIGTGNYQNKFRVTKAKVDFSNDGNGGTEYSGTFVAEGDHALPIAEGITAYIIESINGDEVIATPLDYIPDGVPVLLLTDTDVKGFVVNTPTSYTAITQEQEEANKLIVASGDDGARTFASTQIYLLYYDEFVLNKAGTLDAGKVYMSNPNYSTPTPSPARLKISRGGNTGIENIEYTIKPQSDAWYTLDGRRLSSKPTKKGLYLQGGKKIVVK